MNDSIVTLEASGFIRLLTREPELEYIFRHALMQDAAYASLVKQDRRHLHALIGHSLERDRPNQLDELAPLLAHHFDLAGDDQRALHYYTRAGESAAHKYANGEAVLHLTRALEISKRAALTTDGSSLRALFLQRGQAQEYGGQYTAALANYVEMEQLARTRGDSAMELAGLMARATIYSTGNVAHDGAQALTLSQQALAFAHETGDRAAEAKILWNLMLLYIFGNRDVRQAVAYGEQSLALARALNWREQTALVLNDLYMAYFSAGNLSHARAALEEAGALLRAQNVLPPIADNCARTALVYYCLGDFDAALRAATEGEQLSLASQNIWQVVNNRQLEAFVRYERGEYQQVIRTMEQIIPLGEQVGYVLAVGFAAQMVWTYTELGALAHARAWLAQTEAKAGLFAQLLPWLTAAHARLCVRAGELNDAVALARTAREHFPAMRQGLSVVVQAWTAVLLADIEVALAQTDYTHAIQAADELLENLRTLGVMPYVADALLLKATALLALQNLNEAEQLLREAKDVAQRIGTRRVLWRIHDAMYNVAIQRGDREEASEWRKRARDELTYIVAQIGDAELQQSFLDLPEVRALREEC